MAASNDYLAQMGDTFKSIAKAIFGDEIVAKALADFNKMTEGDAIAQGKTLKIPKRVHVVKNGTKKDGTPVSHVDVLKAGDQIISFDQLKSVSRANDETVNKFLSHFNTVMKKYEITASLRKVHFLAQICHESGGLRYTIESDPDAGARYENRLDLGNTQPGDGERFKGRGLIQLTGRSNYAAFFSDAGLDLTSDINSAKVAEPELATLSAGWFWNKNNLNTYADGDDFLKITRVVNGGYIGYSDRLKRVKRAYQVFSAGTIQERLDKFLEPALPAIEKITKLLAPVKVLTQDEEKRYQKSTVDSEKKALEDFRGKLKSLQESKQITVTKKTLFLDLRTRENLEGLRIELSS
jgi:putative chitinase